MTRLTNLILDMDGVIVRGKQAIDGAVESLSVLDERGIPYVLLTNRSDRSKAAILEALAGAGVFLRADRLICASDLVLAHLQAQSIGSCFVIGDEGFAEDLKHGRMNVFMTARELAVGGSFSGAVVVGAFDYISNAQLSSAVSLLKAGAPLIAANKVREKVKSPGRPLSLGPGFVVHGLELCGETEAVVVGKPSRFSLVTALERLGCVRERVVIVGDRLDEDVGGAVRAGLTSCLVLSGATREDQILNDAEIRPDFLARDLAHAVQLIFGSAAKSVGRKPFPKIDSRSRSCLDSELDESPVGSVSVWGGWSKDSAQSPLPARR